MLAPNEYVKIHLIKIENMGKYFHEMETNRLKQFCTLFEIGSMTEAANVLGISVSGLHKSIKVLEEELGVLLTQPQGRGIILSEQADRLYPRALDILKRTNDLQDLSHMPKESSLRIGGLEVFSFILPHFLSTDEYFLNTPLEIHEIPPGELERQVASGNLDYGLSYIPVPHSEVTHLGVGTFQMKVLAKNSQFAHMEFADIPFVVPKSLIIDNPQGVKSRDGWKNSILRRNEKYQSNSLGIGLELVKAGQAAIYLPHFYKSVIGPQTLQITPPNKKQQKDIRETFLILKKKEVETTMSKKVVRLMRKILASTIYSP